MPVAQELCLVTAFNIGTANSAATEDPSGGTSFVIPEHFYAGAGYTEDSYRVRVWAEYLGSPVALDGVNGPAIVGNLSSWSGHRGNFLMSFYVAKNVIPRNVNVFFTYDEHLRHPTIGSPQTVEKRTLLATIGCENICGDSIPNGPITGPDTDGDGVLDFEDPEPDNPDVPASGGGGGDITPPTIPANPRALNGAEVGICAGAIVTLAWDASIGDPLGE